MMCHINKYCLCLTFFYSALLKAILIHISNLIRIHLFL